MENQGYTYENADITQKETGEKLVIGMNAYNTSTIRKGRISLKIYLSF